VPAYFALEVVIEIEVFVFVCGCVCLTRILKRSVARRREGFQNKNLKKYAHFQIFYAHA
jgi:hypothetical protein